MSTTGRCPRCNAVLPVTAQFCRRCGAAQVGRAAHIDVAATLTAMHPSKASSSKLIQPIQTLEPLRHPRRPWITLLGFFGLIGLGLMFMANYGQTQSTTSVTPQILPASGGVTPYQPPTIVMPSPQMTPIQEPPIRVLIPQIPSPVRPWTPGQPGATGHENDHYNDSHGRGEHGR